MSYARSSRSDLDDRDYPSRRGPARVYDDNDHFDRREFRGSPRRTPAPVREYDNVGRDDRVPSFLREENRKTDAGPLVLRSREIETVDRRRPRSPSPQPLTRYVERPRSVSPPRRSMSRPRPRYSERSLSRSPQREGDFRVDIDSRVVERRRPRSPTPDRERDRIRIMMERERARSPSSSPSPPPPPPSAPPIIKGPTIEREVITHYRDIDHGVERARPPTPPPPSRTPRPITREREQCETDVDIRRSRHEVGIDIRHSHRSRSRPRGQSRPPAYEDGDLLKVRSGEATRRRAHSEGRPREDWDDEAEYITSKIDQRGRMGEAWNGATRDWTIVDVPPGTERVRLDGVGGGGAEVTWQRYNGVRRSKFLPERDGTPGSSGATTVSEPTREPPRDAVDRERLSVQISSSRDRSRDRDEVVEEVRDRRISIRDSSRGPSKRSREMWTEITKDLVIREAIEKRGYEYEETEYFFYVMEYLRYEDVVELVNISDDIRRARRRRAREIEWEREHRDGWDRRHHHRLSLNWDKVDDERVVEREIIYDRPSRTYLR